MVTQARQLMYIYDTSVAIEATTKEEADRILEAVEAAVSEVDGSSLFVFQAFAIEDAETGEELRPLG